MDEIQFQAETVRRELDKINDSMAKLVLDYEDEDQRAANLIMVMLRFTASQKQVGEFMETCIQYLQDRKARIEQES